METTNIAKFAEFIFVCGECGFRIGREVLDPKYCPVCGAKVVSK